MRKKPTTPERLQIMCKGFGLQYSESALKQLKSGEIKIWEDESQSAEWHYAPEFIQMMEKLQEATAYFEKFCEQKFGKL